MQEIIYSCVNSLFSYYLNNVFNNFDTIIQRLLKKYIKDFIIIFIKKLFVYVLLKGIHGSFPTF